MKNWATRLIQDCKQYSSFWMTPTAMTPKVMTNHLSGFNRFQILLFRSWMKNVHTLILIWYPNLSSCNQLESWGGKVQWIIAAYIPWRKLPLLLGASAHRREDIFPRKMPVTSKRSSTWSTCPTKNHDNNQDTKIPKNTRHQVVRWSFSSFPLIFLLEQFSGLYKNINQKRSMWIEEAQISK